MVIFGLIFYLKLLGIPSHWNAPNPRNPNCSGSLCCDIQPIKLFYNKVTLSLEFSGMYHSVVTLMWPTSTWLHGATSQKTLKLHTRRRENLKSHTLMLLDVVTLDKWCPTSTLDCLINYVTASTGHLVVVINNRVYTSILLPWICQLFYWLI
jgi:hypothetical protein